MKVTKNAQYKVDCVYQNKALFSAIQDPGASKQRPCTVVKRKAQTPRIDQMAKRHPYLRRPNFNETRFQSPVKIRLFDAPFNSDYGA